MKGALPRGKKCPENPGKGVGVDMDTVRWVRYGKGICGTRWSRDRPGTGEGFEGKEGRVGTDCRWVLDLFIVVGVVGR